MTGTATVWRGIRRLPRSGERRPESREKRVGRACRGPDVGLGVDVDVGACVAMAENSSHSSLFQGTPADAPRQLGPTHHAPGTTHRAPPRS
ncbi:hypothetical protein [Streptomyces sp. NBC_01508]|uniref:hypothetical protein n=1 Tax=Streptomyces sp. NBC_01508 TaxID=2903888 RepID=UPI0038638543